jgi:hypothetical protein
MNIDPPVPPLVNFDHPKTVPALAGFQEYCEEILRTMPNDFCGLSPT